MDWARHTLLVLALHPDDEAIGCGGLISRVLGAGGRVFVLWVTIADIADFSEAGGSSAAQRREEMRRAHAFWPLTGSHLALPGQDYNLRLDTVPRAELIGLIERGEHPLSLAALAPTVVAIPDPSSYNQDHAALGTAAITALRPGPDTYRHQPSLVPGYEEVGDCWNGGRPGPAPQMFVELSEHDLDRKIGGLAAHASQCRPHPHTRSEHALRALAAVRGAQSGYAFAEAFHCLRVRA
ncbi:PIG-L deacetylase family protein [Nocardia jejuensis]|uniref:PIG-L deacetylase family protein n=1 Tax=Nocardia jejuensis TaxID=328049 RepID=UPI00147094B7|nr:PIG-L family deacetylase [Nocardia jejuensis]